MVTVSPSSTATGIWEVVAEDAFGCQQCEDLGDRGGRGLGVQEDQESVVDVVVAGIDEEALRARDEEVGKNVEEVGVGIGEEGRVELEDEGGHVGAGEIKGGIKSKSKSKSKGKNGAGGSEGGGVARGEISFLSG